MPGRPAGGPRWPIIEAIQPKRVRLQGGADLIRCERQPRLIGASGGSDGEIFHIFDRRQMPLQFDVGRDARSQAIQCWGCHDLVPIRHPTHPDLFRATPFR
jgi:hypothetical protein